MIRRASSILALSLLASHAVAQDSATQSTPQSLQSIGIDFERARSLVGDAASDQLQAIELTLRELPDQSGDDWKASRRQLEGEVLFALGSYRDAAKRFEDARKGFQDKVYTDDAEFWRILALEAEGRDVDAHKAWQAWYERYAGQSSLRAEVERTWLWNALRRGDLAFARTIVERTKKSAPWMLTDTRWLVAEAALELKAGEAELALTVLDHGAQGPESNYVRALAHQTLGNTLKAAGFFQDAAQRHPSSLVRDHAMLAKANIFLDSKVYRSAIEEFQQVLDRAQDPRVRAEASLRHAAAVFMSGEIEPAEQLLRAVASKHGESDIGARAQFLLAEAMVAQERYEDAIVEFNIILTLHFQHAVAASAQYRIGRCLDALERPLDATGAYMAVVAGYPLEPEAPAAAYLAGAGLLSQQDHLAAAPYFQIVVDRYTTRQDADGSIVFSSPEHQELTEAALCLLALSYHRADRLGQLSGALHLMLTRMPESRSIWRAWTVLIDADALAAQGRHTEAQSELEALFAAFPEHPAILPGHQLLAWSYAQAGDDERAIALEERLLRRYANSGQNEQLATARLHIGHVRFNQRRYEEAAQEYEAYLKLAAEPKAQLLPLYQLGLCYQRLGRTGDSVDRWERLVQLGPNAEISEKAWARAGDVYFAAGHYEDAARCYSGLLENFASSAAAATGMLRLAQCAYNAGDDELAISRYSGVLESFPNSAEGIEARRGLELTLYRLGQGEAGVNALAELVQRYPGSSFAADAQFQIASHLFEAGEYSRAAEEFRRVVSQFPNFTGVDRAQLLMGESYAKSGDAVGARAAYEQFRNFFADSELIRTVHFRLGTIYFEEEDYLRTALEFSQVLEQESRDELTTAALFNLAVCQRLLGDHEAATLSFQRYREWFGDDERATDVTLELAQIHRQAGRSDEALREYQSALDKKPSRELAVQLHSEMGAIYEESGNIDAALVCYGKAMESKERQNPFRLSAVARCAAIYEDKEQYSNALMAYRDLARYADDPELQAAAKERAAQLEAFAR